VSSRFSPEWKEVEPFLDTLIGVMGMDERFLVNAFCSSASADSRAGSAAEVKNQLHGIVITPGIPWVLFETISAFLLSLPTPMRASLTNSVSIPTGRGFERLQVDVNGRWQVAWQLNPSGEPEYQYVGLDWYMPKERARAPIVPLPIVDYVAGSVSLLRSNLVLPAFAVLLIALESVLWEDLEARGISRATARVSYSPIPWQFKILGNQLVITVQGADKELQDLGKELGKASSTGQVESTRVRDEGSHATLRVKLSPELLACLTSSREESRELASERGLAEAIQRARPAGILATVPVQLDETLYRLRNALVHLPSDGIIAPPVPVPAGSPIDRLDSLLNSPQFVVELTHIIVNLINSLYGTR
jgi:hypothetical protein